MRTQTLTVAMNGEVVGTLYRDGRGAMSFQYSPEWLVEPGSRAISLSLWTPRLVRKITVSDGAGAK
jgi:serine/threonine-protein kinase HipA